MPFENVPTNEIGMGDVEGNEENCKAAVFYCWFCYRNVSIVIVSGSSPFQNEDVDRRVFKSEENVRDLFFKLVGRQFGDCNNINENGEKTFRDGVGHTETTSDLRSCADCLKIIELYCKLFHQLKSFELQLNWQIEKLWTVMRFADRVPSRVKAFRDWCTSNKNGQLTTLVADPTDGSQEEGRNIPSGGDLVTFRRHFKRRCKTYKSSTLPRIALCSWQPKIEETEKECSRIHSNRDHDLVIASSTVISDIPTNNLHSRSNLEEGCYSDHQACFLGWITSLAAIIFLFHVKVDNEYQQMSPTTSEELPPILNEGEKNASTAESFEANNSLAEDTGMEVEEDETINMGRLDDASIFSHSEESSHNEENCDEEDDKSKSTHFSSRFLEKLQETELKLEKVCNDHNGRQTQNHVPSENDIATTICSSQSTRVFVDDQQQSHATAKCKEQTTVVDEHPFPYQYEDEDHAQFEFPIKVMQHPVETLKNLESTENNPVELQLLTTDNYPSNSFISAIPLVNNCELSPAQPPTNIPYPTCPSLQLILHADQSGTPSPSSVPFSAQKLHSDENFIKYETSPLRRRGLRQVFQCSLCKATFSSSNRLLEHTTAFHGDSSSVNMEISGDEQETWDEGDAVKQDATWSGDRGGVSVSDSDQDENLMDMEWKINPKDESESIDEHNSESDDQAEEREQKPRTLSLRVASKYCNDPKCSNVRFRGFKQVRWHKQYQHSNGHISFLSHQLGKLKMSGLNLENFPSETRHHLCTDCDKAFTHNEELENHKRLHHNTDQNLICQFCDLSIKSVLDFIEHELEHSNTHQTLKDNDFKIGEKFICGRCGDLAVLKRDFINHYLEAHMNLPPVQATCPICKQIFKNVEQVPLQHYVNFHDLTRLTDPSKPFRCEKSAECSAYFLTEDQLHIHWNKAHYVLSSLEDSILYTQRIKSEKEARKNHKLYCKSNVCPHCSKAFQFPTALRAHVWKQHGKGKELINKNSLSSYCKKLVISHPDSEEKTTVEDLATDKKAKYFCCVEHCSRGFMKEEDLNNHSKLHGEFKCDFCDVIKKFAPELAVHESVHSDAGTGHSGHAFRCSRCLFKTNKKTKYIEHHVETHLNLVMDKKKCPICEYVYPWNTIENRNHDLRDSMVKHYLEYHDLSMINEEGSSSSTVIRRCERDKDKCKAYFKTVKQLQDHIMDVHEKMASENERHKCQDCGKCFRKARLLTGHRIRAHKLSRDNFPFVCKIPECKERYEREVDLEQHVKVCHKEGRKCLECPECGKKCWTKSALTWHLRGSKHRGGLPHPVCEECGKSFKNKTQLNNHMQFHAGPESWKFSCSVCNKKIVSQQKLDEHMRTHTKATPFICQVCGVAYRHRHNLRIHVNNKHGLQDVPRQYDRINSTASTRKGKKLKT